MTAWSISTIDRMWVDDLKNTWIGDANLDGEFNSGDMVQVFVGGKYETGEDAGWEEGDWNGDMKFRQQRYGGGVCGGWLRTGPASRGRRRRRARTIVAGLIGPGRARVHGVPAALSGLQKAGSESYDRASNELIKASPFFDKSFAVKGEGRTAVTRLGGGLARPVLKPSLVPYPVPYVPRLTRRIHTAGAPPAGGDRVRVVDVKDTSPSPHPSPRGRGNRIRETWELETAQAA